MQPNLEKSAQVSHISQQHFKTGEATIARRSRPPRLHDWSKAPDRAASLSVPLCSNYPTKAMHTHSSEQLKEKCSTPYNPRQDVSKRRGRAKGCRDQVARIDGGRGRSAARKKQATQRRGVMSTLFCIYLRGKMRKKRNISCCRSPRSNHGEAEG